MAYGEGVRFERGGVKMFNILGQYVLPSSFVCGVLVLGKQFVLSACEHADELTRQVVRFRESDGVN